MKYECSGLDTQILDEKLDSKHLILQYIPCGQTCSRYAPYHHNLDMLQLQIPYCFLLLSFSL